MARNSLEKPFAGLRKINLEGLRFRLIDAEDQIAGRLCAQIAMIIQGKDKPIFAPHKNLGDVCVVVNASKVVFTGKKWDQKTYKHHSGFPGGLKEIVAKDLWAKDPTEIIFKAVRGMLPKNRLLDERLLKLRIFPGPQHAFEQFPLVPFEMPPRRLRDKRLGWPMPEGFVPMNPDAYAMRMKASRFAAGAGGGEGAGGEGPPEPPQVAFEDLLGLDEREQIERLAAEQQQQQLIHR